MRRNKSAGEVGENDNYVHTFLIPFLLVLRWKNKVKGGAGCCYCQAAMLPAAERAEPRVSYRLRLPHVDGRADGRRLALSSPLHLLHHTVHVAPGEAMEKHGCRRGQDVVAVLFSGSARQDVHQRQKSPRGFTHKQLAVFGCSLCFRWQVEKSRSRGKIK